MAVRKINSIKEISDNYEFFIIDIWGVLHDGDINAFPHALEALKFLKENSKTSLILSNSPRNVIDVTQTLTDKGITDKLYDFLYTSGQEVEDLLYEKSNEFFQNLGNKVYILGFSNLHEKAGHSVVETIEEADYILATRVPGDELSYSKELLDQAITLKIPLVCANPDLVAQTFAGPCPCPGIVYEYYKKQGGHAVAIGKPNSEVYERVFKLLTKHNNAFDKKKTLVIGDGLFTDILGANRNDLDSVLISSGIHADTFDFDDLPSTMSESEFAKLSLQAESKPKYISKLFN